MFILLFVKIKKAILPYYGTNNSVLPPKLRGKFLTTQRTDKAVRASIHHRTLGKRKSRAHQQLTPTAASLKMHLREYSFVIV